MRIRPLRYESDFREALRVRGRAWRAAYDDFLPEGAVERAAELPSDSEIAERFERLRGRCFLVAVAGDGTDAGTRAGRDTEDGSDGETGSVVGYAYFRWGDDETRSFVGDDAAELKEIYVDPDHWNRGVGTGLLERGLHELPDGLPTLRLGMLADNDVAPGFYETRGFERVDETVATIGGTSVPVVVYELDR